MTADGRGPLHQRPKHLRMRGVGVYINHRRVAVGHLRTGRMKERPTELCIPSPSNNPSSPNPAS